jgi:hypothetical protein
MKNIHYIFITLITLTSCSFNKLFLQPTKIPSTAKGLSMKAGTDTVVIRFATDKHDI